MRCTLLLLVVSSLALADLCQVVLKNAAHRARVRALVEIWVTPRERTSDGLYTAHIDDHRTGVEFLESLDREEAPLLSLPAYPQEEDFHSFPLSKIAWAPKVRDQDYVLATGDRDGVVKVWNIHFAKRGQPADMSYRLMHTRHPTNVPVTALAFSPDGKTLVSAAGKEVIAWDLVNDREAAKVRFPEIAIVRDVYVSADWIYATGPVDDSMKDDRDRRKFLRVWDRAGKPRVDAPIQNVGDVSPFTDHVIRFKDGARQLLNLETYACPALTPAEAPAVWHGFSRTGAMLVMQDHATRKIRVLRTRDRKLLLEFDAPAFAQFIYFSNDEKNLVTIVHLNPDARRERVQVQVRAIRTGELLTGVEYTTKD